MYSPADRIALRIYALVTGKRESTASGVCSLP